MTKQEFIQWICEKLTAILQFEVHNDMAEYVIHVWIIFIIDIFSIFRYIISMQSERDLDDYCCSLLDIKSPVHKQFLFDLKKRHRLCKFISMPVSIFIFYFCIIPTFWNLVNQIPSSNVENTQLPKQTSKNQNQEEKVKKKNKSKDIYNS